MSHALRRHFTRTVSSFSSVKTPRLVSVIETRHVAEEAGISKPTLTGVLRTLESRGLLRRRTHPDDARRVLVHLTPRGARLMGQLFPKFNAEEVRVTESLSRDDTQGLARNLRSIVVDLEHVEH